MIQQNLQNITFTIHYLNIKYKSLIKNAIVSHDKPHYSIAPLFYGFPKIYKEINTTRPIVS